MGVEGSDFRPRGKQAGPHYEKRLRAASVKTAPAGRHTDGGGLFLEVDPSGARRWLLRIVIKGRRRDLGLGSASLVSLADVRAKAQEFRAVARAGGEPPCATAQSRSRCSCSCSRFGGPQKARAAEELGLLPDRSAIAEMLSDYSMMREQGRSCQR